MQWIGATNDSEKVARIDDRLVDLEWRLENAARAGDDETVDVIQSQIDRCYAKLDELQG
jgi:hypothetical protein